MDKEAFYLILEASLLTFEGFSENDIVIQYGINPKFAKLGVQLCSYLKSKEIKT